MYLAMHERGGCVRVERAMDLDGNRLLNSCTLGALDWDYTTMHQVSPLSVTTSTTVHRIGVHVLTDTTDSMANIH